MTESFAIPVSQSASGTYQAVASNTLLNTVQMGGSQTINGRSPSTNGSLVLTWGNGFSGLPTVSTGSSGSFSVSGAGAVSPWYGGQQTNGLMNSTVTVGGSSVNQIPMQIIYDPTTGNLISQVAMGNGGSGSFLNAVMAATPTSTGYTTTSLYQTTNSGSATQTSSSPYSTALFTGSGLTGTMLLGGSGAIVTVPITAGFNFSGYQQPGQRLSGFLQRDVLSLTISSARSSGRPAALRTALSWHPPTIRLPVLPVLTLWA